jgi:hypothetical protein
LDFARVLSPEFLSLDRDLPTTSDDVAVLARVRATGPTGLASYLQFLAGFPPPPPAALRARRGPGGAPFELVAGRRDGSGAGPVAER